ncbi:MAG: hypothetical protein HKP23_01130 [Flavobacteriaceae bacterium]|nr:hypothetical protein [Eudoraea sp.]NNJ37826.1 hypothetical protein [Flavobacteriaceae bacterium]NNK31048.1 hypothetical protein [Flavobacteriaceae bacterium]
MAVFQSIMVYLALGIALLYLLKRFVLPRKWFTSKKAVSQGCGEDNCQCH